VNQPNGSSALIALSIIFFASCGLVANLTSSPIPAAAHRSWSWVHDFGTYSSRSISTRVPLAGTA
jgi:hypothetical protein